MKTNIEQRLKIVEAKVAALSKRTGKVKKPWLQHDGWAKDDPIYDKAMKLGAAWRKSS